MLNDNWKIDYWIISSFSFSFLHNRLSNCKSRSPCRLD